MKKNKYFSVFFAALMFLTAPLTAFADKIADGGKNSSITICAQWDETALKGVNFDLYLVAAAGENGVKTAAEGFEKFEIYFNSDLSYLQKLAVTLEGHSVKEGIAAIDGGKTDENGKLVFPNNGDEIQPGIYLVTSHTHIQGNYVYTAEPFIVHLPSLDESGKPDYNVTAYPKFSREGVDEVYTKITVVKVWKDSGYEKKRPLEIKVNLYRNGELYDFALLNEDNGWQRMWRYLDKSADWTIAEEEVEGYETVIEKDGYVYIVTNTYNEPPKTPEIPKTGQNMLPARILFTAGIILSLAGRLCRDREKNEE